MDSDSVDFIHTQLLFIHLLSMQKFTVNTCKQLTCFSLISYTVNYILYVSKSVSTVQKQELIFSKEDATKDQTLTKLSSLVVHLLLSCDSLCIPASKQLNVTVKQEESTYSKIICHYNPTVYRHRHSNTSVDFIVCPCGSQLTSKL